MLTPKNSNRRKNTRFELNVDGHYFYKEKSSFETGFYTLLIKHC